MNVVEVTGRLTRDPEIRFVGDSRFPIAELNLGVENGKGRWNRESKKVEVESGFYKVTIVGAYGEQVASELRKGDPVYVKGSLKQDRYQSKSGDGETKTSTTIDADVVTSLSGKMGSSAARVQPPAHPLTDGDPGPQPGWDDEPF